MTRPPGAPLARKINKMPRPPMMLVCVSADGRLGRHTWMDVMPRGGRGDPAWEQWSVGFREWCAERGTDPLAVFRLRVRAKGWRW